MVFIDGLHDFESVREDIRAWATKVRHGGILAGHDYCARYMGVVQAVNEHLAAIGGSLHLGPDSLWWYYVGEASPVS